MNMNNLQYIGAQDRLERIIAANITICSNTGRGPAVKAGKTAGLAKIWRRIWRQRFHVHGPDYVSAAAHEP